MTRVEQEKAILENSKLLKTIASKYWIDGYTRQDLYQEAVVKYLDIMDKRPDKLKVKGYLGRSINNRFKTMLYIQKAKRITYETGYDFSLSHITPDSNLYYIHDFDTHLVKEQIFKLLENKIGSMPAFALTLKLQGERLKDITFMTNEEFGKDINNRHMHMILKRAMKSVGKTLSTIGAL